MKRNEALWELVTTAVALLVWWLTTRDGPPLKTVFWYHTYRGAQHVAWWAGRAGLAAERTYHRQVETARGGF